MNKSNLKLLLYLSVGERENGKSFVNFKVKQNELSVVNNDLLKVQIPILLLFFKAIQFCLQVVSLCRNYLVYWPQNTLFKKQLNIIFK